LDISTQLAIVDAKIKKALVAQNANHAACIEAIEALKLVPVTVSDLQQNWPIILTLKKVSI